MINKPNMCENNYVARAKLALSQIVYELGKKVVNLADNMPEFNRVEVRRTNPEESNVQFFPERNNYAVFDVSNYAIMDDKLDDLDRELTEDSRLKRDIVWCFQNRHKINPLIGNAMTIRRKSGFEQKEYYGHEKSKTEYRGANDFTRPYANTICLTAVCRDEVFKYVVSLSEEELRQAHVDGIDKGIGGDNLCGIYLIGKVKSIPSPDGSSNPPMIQYDKGQQSIL